MKITISKVQWEMIGKKTGWIRTSQAVVAEAPVQSPQALSPSKKPSKKPAMDKPVTPQLPKPGEHQQTPRTGPQGKATGEKYAGLTEQIDIMLAKTLNNLDPKTLCDPKLGEANVCPSPSDIPRIQMPNFASQNVQPFIDELAAKGITTESIPAIQPDKVKNSQTNVVTSIVASMLHWDRNKPAAENIQNIVPPDTSHAPILISGDNYILDGHHRWAWAKVYNQLKGEETANLGPVLKINLPIRYLIGEAGQSQHAMRHTDNDDIIKPLDPSTGYKYAVFAQGRRPSKEKGKEGKDIPNRVHNAFVDMKNQYVVNGQVYGTFVDADMGRQKSMKTGIYLNK